MMALLYDSSLEFPSEWSTQQLPRNGKSKKRLNAWAEFHEEPSRTERWAPAAQRLLGEEDMIITRTLKVHSAISFNFHAVPDFRFIDRVLAMMIRRTRRRRQRRVMTP